MKSGRKKSLGIIAEEESVHSKLSCIMEKSEMSDNQSENDEMMPKFTVKESTNDKISSVRKEIYKLSQYITSKEKQVRSKR